jgi:hypothetical protein
MKISAEAADANRKLINEIKTRWQKHEENMNKKSPLEYLEEIKQTTKVSFEIGAFPSESAFDRETYKPGDGDFVQGTRPGAMDHKKYKSKGLGDDSKISS